MPFKVLEKNILVQVDAKPEKYGKLYLPEGGHPTQFVKATVVDVGEEVETVKKGDRILKINNLGTKLTSHDGKEEFWIVPVSNVITIITGEDAKKEQIIIPTN